MDLNSVAGTRFSPAPWGHGMDIDKGACAQIYPGWYHFGFINALFSTMISFYLRMRLGR